MGEALLSVSNLSIDIDSAINPRLTRGESRFLKSIKDISFDIFPGEILGLVGESGAGKSLTALAIAGLLDERKKVRSGAILFKNSGESRDLLKLPERDLQNIRGKEISIVFQEPISQLNPLLRVGEQITETLVLHGQKDKNKNKTHAKELIEKMKIRDSEKIMGSFPHQLSGGMCQRVMIAQAVICRPTLLIADEPTTALDEATEDQILALLKEINSEFGTSILFISHDLKIIKNFCSRVLVMYSGRILEEGAAEDIFSRPAHEYTKGLLGCIPAGRAGRGKDLTVIPGKIPSLEEGHPPGCPFHPRCARAELRCKGEFPPERIIGDNHKTRCILEEDDV